MIKKQKRNAWMPAPKIYFYSGMIVALLFLALPLHAEGKKRYNFNTKSSAQVQEPVIEQKPDAPKIVDGVYSPGNSKPINKTKKAEQLVRLFVGTCLKYYGRTSEMIEAMDDKFSRLDDERKAEFSPVINGTLTTQYWDVTMDDALYMLAKDTSNGKCNLIAKDTPSTFMHHELKRVLDGLTMADVLTAEINYEKVINQNKEVSFAHILGHPFEKELSIVATSKINDTGDNIGAILTMFTVPQETVEIK